VPILGEAEDRHFRLAGGYTACSRWSRGNIMMTIQEYLAEIEYAAGNLISIIWEERKRLQAMEMELERLTPLVKENYLRAESVALNAQDFDDDAMAVGMYWENYFGDDKERHAKTNEREKLAQQVAAHTFSASALAGSLLQYAKQGISLTHGDLASTPSGRAIGGQFLRDVIWQSRNQAIHWEEGKPRDPVRQCFDKLAQEVAPHFAEYTNRSMAFDVVELLAWTDFDKFNADLLLLA